MFLIVAALEEEVIDLQKYLQKNAIPQANKKLLIKNIKFTHYKIANKHIALLICGVGKVCSSSALASVSAVYDITQVLSVGSCLGLQAVMHKQQVTLHTGDIVCARSSIEYDADYAPFSKNTIYNCDEDMHKKLCNGVTNTTNKVTQKPNIYTNAIIASGDTFVKTNKTLPSNIINLQKTLLQTYTCIVVDMENAALAKFLYTHTNIKFVILAIVLDVVNIGIQKNKKINFREDIKKISASILQIVLDTFLMS